MSYHGSNFETWFARANPDPVGVYSSDCYGDPQSVTVSRSGSNYVVQAEPRCFTYTSDDDPLYCIYCSAACPAGHQITLEPHDARSWTGVCGPYEITLAEHCE